MHIIILIVKQKIKCPLNYKWVLQLIFLKSDSSVTSIIAVTRNLISNCHKWQFCHFIDWINPMKHFHKNSPFCFIRIGKFFGTETDLRSTPTCFISSGKIHFVVGSDDILVRWWDLPGEWEISITLMVKVTSWEDKLTSVLAQKTSKVALVTSLVSKSNHLRVARVMFGLAQVTY